MEVLKKNLAILSELGSKKVSNSAAEILNQFENMSLDAEEFKKIQFNFFSGFDSLIQKIQSFGLVKKFTSKNSRLLFKKICFDK